MFSKEESDELGDNTVALTCCVSSYELLKKPYLPRKNILTGVDIE